MNRAARQPHIRIAADPEPLRTGWETYPAGTLAGHPLEVAFDPRRHDVLRSIGDTSPTVRKGLGDQGWSRLNAGDDGTEIWIRDRNHAARTSLLRLAAVGADALGISR